MTFAVAEPKTLWQRVIAAFTPWSHRTRRADVADAEMARLAHAAEHRHYGAQRTVREAYQAIGRRLDERP